MAHFAVGIPLLNASLELLSFMNGNASGQSVASPSRKVEQCQMHASYSG